MPLKKAFQVQVELTVQAVSCPGVWLCPNGNVELQIYMLDSCVHTSSLEPLFPLLFQEKFVFCKKFFTAKKLNELQKVLNRQILYCELIQWQNCGTGNLLASFQTTLGDLLYPGSKNNCLAGTEIDLLMEPMKNFPGILHPKIEVSTKTTIEDILCEKEDPTAYVINPYTISSCIINQSDANYRERPFVRQKRVCHNSKYHENSAGCNCPQKAAGKPKQTICPCRSDRKVCPEIKSREKSIVCCKDSKVRQGIQCSNKSCPCGQEHQENCVICAKYKYYFENANQIKSCKNINSNLSNDQNLCTESYLGNCPSDCGGLSTLRKLSNYPPSYEDCGTASLARRIHNRLSDSLNQCMNTGSDFCSGCDGGCCEALEDSGCGPKNFGQMYKQLYNSLK